MPALPGQVPVRNLDGTVDLVPANELEQAIAEGSRPATDQEYTAAKLGAGGKIGTAGLGLARGGSNGVSDWALVEGSRLLGGDTAADDTRGAINLARSTHEGINTAGELAGMGLSLAYGGGEAKGAQIAAKSLLGRAGQAALRAAPRAFAEGAAMGVGQQLSEDALGDHETTAQKLFGAGFEGGAIGVLLGGGLAGIGTIAGEKLGAGAARKLAGEETPLYGEAFAPGTAYRTPDAERVAEKTYGPKGVGDALESVRGQYVKASAGIAGKDAATLDKFTRLDDAGKEARRIAVFDSEKEVESVTRSLRSAGDELERAMPDITDEFRGELKGDKIAKLVSREDEAAKVAFAKQHIDDVIASVEAELSHADGVAGATAKSLENISKSAYKGLERIEEAVAAKGDAARAAFMALDETKRAVQAFTDRGYNSTHLYKDLFDRRLAERTVTNMDRAQEGVRRGLEDVGVWGEAGAAQAEINGAWSRMIDSRKRYKQAFLTDVGRSAKNPFVQQLGIDPSKLDTQVRGLVDAKNDLTHQAIKDYIGAAQDFAKTIRSRVDLPAHALESVKRVEASAGTFGTELERAEKVLTLVNQHKALSSKTADSFGGLAGALGFATGGPVGGIIGTIGGALMSPGRTVAQLAALERMGAQVDDKIGGAVRGLFSGKSGKLPGGTPKPPPVTQETVEKLRESVMNPAAVTARVSQAFSRQGMADAAPKVSQAMARTAMRAAAYLQR